MFKTKHDQVGMEKSKMCRDRSSHRSGIVCNVVDYSLLIVFSPIAPATIVSRSALNRCKGMAEVSADKRVAATLSSNELENERSTFRCVFYNAQPVVDEIKKRRGEDRNSLTNSYGIHNLDCSLDE